MHPAPADLPRQQLTPAPHSRQQAARLGRQPCPKSMQKVQLTQQADMQLKQPCRLLRYDACCVNGRQPHLIVNEVNEFVWVCPDVSSCLLPQLQVTGCSCAWRQLRQLVLYRTVQAVTIRLQPARHRHGTRCRQKSAAAMRRACAPQTLPAHTYPCMALAHYTYPP